MHGSDFALARRDAKQTGEPRARIPKRRTEHKSSRNPQGGLGREADQSVSEFPLLREKTEPAAEREKEGERGDEGQKRSTRAKFRTFSSSRLVCSKQGAKPSAQPVIWDMTSWTLGRGGRVIARLADHRPSADQPVGVLRVKKVPLVEGLPSAGTRDLS